MTNETRLIERSTMTWIVSALATGTDESTSLTARRIAGTTDAGSERVVLTTSLYYVRRRPPRRVWDTRDRVVDGDRFFCTERRRVHVTDDADDAIERGAREAVWPDAFTDRILARPEPLRERLADDNRSRRGIVVVLISEWATLQYRNAERIEEPRRALLLRGAGRQIGCLQPFSHAAVLKALNGASVPSCERKGSRQAS